MSLGPLLVFVGVFVLVHAADGFWVCLFNLYDRRDDERP